MVVGRLGAVYGIKGWMKITSYTDIPEGIFDYSPWYIQQKGEWKEVAIEDFKRHGKGLIAKLAGVDVREEAQSMTGAEIAIYATQLPELEDDFYWRDLIGCAVETDKGYTLGTVSDMMETGSNDVLVVKANATDAFGKKERLIPFLTEQVIINVDITARKIIVNWEPNF
jgi:16S rRNA processing protein RimM